MFCSQKSSVYDDFKVVKIERFIKGSFTFVVMPEQDQSASRVYEGLKRNTPNRLNVLIIGTDKKYFDGLSSDLMCPLKFHPSVKREGYGYLATYHAESCQHAHEILSASGQVMPLCIVNIGKSGSEERHNQPGCR